MKNQTHNDLPFVVRKLDDNVIQPVVKTPTPAELLSADAVSEKVGFKVYTPDDVPDEFFLSGFDAVEGAAVQQFNTPEMCGLDGVCTPGSTLTIRQSQTDATLPEGETVTVRGHAGVYSENRLTWRENGDTFEITSNSLDRAALVQIAESLHNHTEKSR